MAKLPHSLTAPLGFRATGGAFGIKPSGRPDLALIVADVPARAAAVFTINRMPSPAVQLGRRHVAGGKCRAIVINAGIANASTGQAGYRDATAVCAHLASLLGCATTEVLSCSTGLIGPRIPVPKIQDGMERLLGRLERSANADHRAARAIMTTDTVPKAAVRRFKLGRQMVTIGGMAKGSGMIAPNMATMLGFITTDADISVGLLRTALRDAVEADASFNRLSIDSDMSPSDTVVLLASGRAAHKPIRSRSADYRKFVDALTDLCRDLAYQVIRDGEGVEHVIRVVVRGAKSRPQAHRLARAVADSPLVKTAVHGGDPNWGRLAMAAGKAGVELKESRLQIRIGSMVVFKKGRPAAMDLRKLATLMRQKEVRFTFDLDLGSGGCEVLGCDLSRRYITINADYHT